MYEQRRVPPISKREFRGRVVRHITWIVIIIAAALAIGVLGYHTFAGLGWIDALLNASMILGGMGPVDRLESDGAKLFASFYALFSGLAFIGIAGLFVAPFAHRVLHHFHWEAERGDE